MNVKERFGCGNSHNFSDVKAAVFGLECEIEGLHNNYARDFGMMKCIKDGSLRGGFEYISMMPSTKTQTLEQFLELHKNLKFNGEAFGPRTSTHVHMNVQNLDTTQVRTLVLLYALFEEFFFAYVKPERRNNIHCVPLTDTTFPQFYNHELELMLEKWHKYTALNLKRILDLGTVEFRHLHGTGDAQELGTWLGFLEKLWELCQQVEITQANLANREMILGWFDTIFGGCPRIMMLRPNLFNIIGDSLIDVKMSTI